MQGKKSFVLYADIIFTIQKLSDEKAGQLFKIILKYVNDENPVIEDPILDLVFEPIKQSLKRDLDKWRLFIEKQRLNGQLGGRPPKNPEEPKKAKPLEENPKKPMSVSVSVNDSVNVNEIINTPPTPKGEFDLFIQDFNKLTNRNYRGDKKTKGQLTQRLKEGFTMEEILQAVANCLKDPYHVSNPNYLTPEFITRTDKLQKYINWISPVQVTEKPKRETVEDAINQLDNTPRR